MVCLCGKIKNLFAVIRKRIQIFLIIVSNSGSRGGNDRNTLLLNHIEELGQVIRAFIGRQGVENDASKNWL